MLWVVRLTVLVIELVGLFFTVKLAHDGNFGGALSRLAFDVLVVLVFVLSHALVEQILGKLSVKKKGAWEGRTWWL